MYFVHPQLKSIKPLFKKTSEALLKEKLAKFFPNRHILFTNLGRSAFQIAIKELNLENSEMLVPAYICDIFLPIFEKYNIKPIYLDIDLKTFNIQISEIEKKITAQTKSILVSHTYGLAIDMDKISQIARKYNLKIIEDCAHIFPSKNINDCAFFSFTKLCPTIDGGILVSKNPIGFEPKNYKFKLSNLIRFARLFPSLANLSEIFRKEEKTLATIEFTLPRKTSKISLKIFDFYLKNLRESIRKRIELAEYFQKKLTEIGFEVQESKNNTFTYLSALVPKNLERDELFNRLRKKHIFCSRIWHKPIYLNLPNTSEAAKRIINFPLQNWFTEKDIDKIIAGILSKKD